MKPDLRVSRAHKIFSILVSTIVNLRPVDREPSIDIRDDGIDNLWARSVVQKLNSAIDRIVIFFKLSKHVQ